MGRPLAGVCRRSGPRGGTAMTGASPTRAWLARTPSTESSGLKLTAPGISGFAKSTATYTRSSRTSRWSARIATILADRCGPGQWGNAERRGPEPPPSVVRPGRTSGARDQVLVGGLRHHVPRVEARRELVVRVVRLLRDRALGGLFLVDLARELLQGLHDVGRERHDLDLALELGPELAERDDVLRVVLTELERVHRRAGVVEDAPQVHREPVVHLLVEDELARRAGLVPAGIVVVFRGLVQAELHVVVRPDPFRGVDDAALEGRVDLTARREDDGAARSGDDLAAETRDAHLQALVVGDRVDLLAEPAAHLHAGRGRWARHEVEGLVGLLPELDAVAVVVPDVVPLRVHAERHAGEPLAGRLLARVVVGGRVVHLDRALRAGVEDAERGDQLARGEDLDLEPSAAHLVDHLREPLGVALQHVQRGRPARRHAPLVLRLRDDVRRVDRGRRAGGHQHPAGLHQKSASLHRDPPVLEFVLPWTSGGRIAFAPLPGKPPACSHGFARPRVLLYMRRSG